jgi:hypothetical protein
MDPAIFIAGHRLGSDRRRPVYAEAPPWERSRKGRLTAGPIAAAATLVGLMLVVFSVA